MVSSDLGAGHYSFQTCETPGGDRGVLRNRYGTLAPYDCPTPSDQWIAYSADASGRASSNVLGAKSSDPIEQVKEAFACIAYLGGGGCGFEHQLESAKRALEGCQYPNAACKTNPGFIRPDARLAIVFVTDEDDCSARRDELFDPSQVGLDDPLGPLNSFRCTEFGLVCSEKLREPGVKHNCVPGLDYLYSVDRYTEFFRGLKPPGRVMLFALAGPLEPIEVARDGLTPALKISCSTPAGAAVPAVRIATVVKSFAGLGHFNEGVVGEKKIEVNVCAVDFSPALQLLGELIVASLGDGGCLPAPPLTEAKALVCRAGDELRGATCTKSCLELASCEVEESGVPVKKCPRQLFDSKVLQDACGSSCPCWRVLPAPHCHTSDSEGAPYALQIMRSSPAPRGPNANVSARCLVAPSGWSSPGLASLPQCQ